ncbi:MAG: hypothetical protein NTZ89_06245 [Actinobacteria bacterium]|nr:hypothetical protein [Actinomycetota bacterium]
MLVFFAAFKKEAVDLLKTIKLKKIIKIKSTVIYDGTIKNKRIIICIMGMGKYNSLFAVAEHLLTILILVIWLFMNQLKILKNSKFQKRCGEIKIVVQMPKKIIW